MSRCSIKTRPNCRKVDLDPYQKCNTITHSFTAAPFGEQGEHQASLTALIVDGELRRRGAEATTAIGHKNARQAILKNVDHGDKTILDNLRSPPGRPLPNGNEGASVYIT